LDTLVAPEEFDNRLVIGVNKKDSRGQGVEGSSEFETNTRTPESSNL
jgi:hypothetical protein